MIKQPFIILIFSFLIFSCQKHPEADFKVSNEEVFKGEKVYFSNASSDATKYYWDFGDSSTSEDENPTHIYTEAGTYDVTLTAYSKNDKIQSKTEKTILVNSITADLMAGTWKMTEIYNDMDYNVYNTIDQVYPCYVKIDENGNVTTSGLPMFLYIGFGSIDYNLFKDTLDHFLTYNSNNFTIGNIVLPTNSITQMFNLNLDLKLISINAWNHLFTLMGFNSNNRPELIESVLYSVFDDVTVVISDDNRDEMIWQFTDHTESSYYYSNQTDNKILWDGKNSSDMGLTHVYFERTDSLIFQ